MMLDHDTCYRALETRDRRFDGRFFTGVKSTGIFCRPICPAQTPLERNCTFFACAAAAHDAGFRPCRRCRPEAAPGSAAWRGTSNTVTRAMRLIAEGALDRESVPELAARLGVGDRHLRRLFDEQLGASPLAIARTRRIHLAKRLIEDTELPMGQVALAAGFSNVRRFNAAMKLAFDRTPSGMRAAGGRRAVATQSLRLRLSYRPPLRWESMVDYLRARAIPGVEVVTPDVYQRSVDVGEFQGVVEVRPAERGRDELELRVPHAAATHLGALAARVRVLFDLDADVAEIGAGLGRDPDLRARLRGGAAPRVPGSFDPFELAVRAVLGQQVTVSGATRLSGRLVERFGRRLDENWQLFPRPDDLIDAPIESIGLPRARAECLRTLARARIAAPHRWILGAGLDETTAWWESLPGIGPWTAHYVAMRALHEPDAFPDGDLGLRKEMARDGKPMTSRQLARRAEGWRPFRAYAAMTLWTIPTPVKEATT